MCPDCLPTTPYTAHAICPARGFVEGKEERQGKKPLQLLLGFVSVYVHICVLCMCVLCMCCVCVLCVCVVYVYCVCDVCVCGVCVVYMCCICVLCVLRMCCVSGL